MNKAHRNNGTSRNGNGHQVTRYWLLFLACITVSQATADDIELFVTTNSAQNSCDAPNVLFLIDASGSMTTKVETQEAWNPSETYVGCFDTNKFYYSATGSQPECGSDTNFNKGLNACAAILSTEYTGEFQTWDATNERWIKLIDANTDTTFVECAADEGVDGNGSGNQSYAVDGSTGPWSAAESDRIAWGSSASAGTVYDGNWLNWLQNPPTTVTTRLAIVEEATKATLDNLSNVNVALASFNTDDGASMLYASAPIDTARAPIRSLLDDGLEIGVQGWLSESLFELGQYLRGSSIEFGTAPSGESVASSRQGGTLASNTYLSPLNSTGQNTFIVAMTDGDVSGDTSADPLITALPEYATLVGQSCDGDIDGACAGPMAEYMFKADLRPDIPGQQNAITHTIGFTDDDALTASVAERGGGRYFVVDNTASLTAALSDISRDFARAGSLQTPLLIPTNAFNPAARLDDVYVSVFQAASTQHWPGNVKRYRRQQTDDGDILIDANGNNAIDPITGLFNENAVSFWSNPTVDGGDATLGGAASQLPPPSSRKLLSNITGFGLTAVRTDNANITAALVGAPDAERDATIAWARGTDSRDADGDGDRTEPRFSIGDPLHVQPVVVTYGTDSASSNAVVFVTTNDGYLHAFDAVTGTEIWAFIPVRLLSRLYELSLNDPALNKSYGLDGELRVVKTNGRTLLIFGMRRGGQAIFAMDVTNKTSPTLAWVIDSDDPGFADLGQTWSPATTARIAVGGGGKDVLLFGGGYDPGQDNGSFRTDSKGNAIFMVNAATGDLEWSAGGLTARGSHDLDLERMNFSIPAGPRIIDTDGDGLDDRLYVGDMGGQVWRIDFINGNSRATLGEGGVLASLGAFDTGGRADARRFYNTPDVVDIILDNTLFTVVNIGSGFRAHPLDTSTIEEFYSIRDFRAQEVIPSADYDTPVQRIITRDDLRDITDDLSPVLDTTDPGWRLSMEGAGEKVLSSSITIDNATFFSSFTPASSQGTCLPNGGTNRLYRVDVLTGSIVPTNRDTEFDPADYTKTDRYVEVGDGQDAPQQTSRSPDGSACLGLDCFDGEDEFAVQDDDGNTIRSGAPRFNGTYWFPVTQP